ncbi:MAG: RNA polymerase sigma-70 factor [Bacteroidota bacterium]
MQPQTDSELILNIRAGDIRSFERMFNLYAENLVRYATTIVKNSDDAEDIVQQLFVTLWDKKGIPDAGGSLKSYLYRSVYNSSLNKLKQVKVRESYAADSNYVSDGHAASANEVLEHKETAHRIEAAIEELPEQCRLIFRMSRIEQLRYQEIADQLGLSVKTVEAQMGKALKHMRVRLKDYVPAIIIYLLFNN